jgi:hypothetical protein
MLQSLNMASTMVNQTSGLSRLKSGRRASQADMVLEAAGAAVFMAPCRG